MALYADSAVLEDIARVGATFPLAGVTTNPTILLAALERGQRLDDLAVLRELLGLCDGPVFMQPDGDTDEALFAGAGRYLAVAPDRVVPKLPMTPAGLRAGRRLRREGARFAFTAVATLAQAYCGAIAGAGWIIPYFGRLRRSGQDPCERVAHMAGLLAAQATATRVLAASLKSGADLVEATLAGAHDATVAPDVIEGLLDDPLTATALRQFGADWGTFQQRLAAR
jgi:TalC/MipB family fructose-6-phosphate aldolase